MSEVHPNDKVYALQRAVRLAEQAGEAAAVVNDLRALLAAAQLEARRA